MQRIVLLSAHSFLFGIGVGACAGADRGELKVDGPTVVMDRMWGCEGTRVALRGCGQETPMGIAPNVLIGGVVRQYESTLQWQPPSGPVDHVFEGWAEETISIEILPLEGEDCAGAAYVESHWCNEPETSCPSLGCMSRVEVDADFSLTSSDGSLVAQWRGPLGVVSQDEGLLVHARSSGASFDAVGGSIDADSFSVTEPGWTFRGYEIQMEVSLEDDAIRGRFIVHVFDPDKEPWMNTVAVWPPP
jgi:hypothetical protein